MWIPVARANPSKQSHDSFFHKSPPNLLLCLEELPHLCICPFLLTSRLHFRVAPHCKEIAAYVAKVFASAESKQPWFHMIHPNSQHNCWFKDHGTNCDMNQSIRWNLWMQKCYFSVVKASAKCRKQTCRKKTQLCFPITFHNFHQHNIL